MIPVAPMTISPRRKVPAHIPRPEYVDKPGAGAVRRSEVKDAETIERMRLAGRLAAQAREPWARTSYPG